MAGGGLVTAARTPHARTYACMLRLSHAARGLGAFHQFPHIVWACSGRAFARGHCLPIHACMLTCLHARAGEGMSPDKAQFGDRFADGNVPLPTISKVCKGARHPDTWGRCVGWHD